MKSEESRKDMWYVFKSDRYMYQQIRLLEKIIAEKCCADNLKSPHPSLLEQSASLAHTYCENKENYSIDKDKVAVWIEAFKQIPEFKDALKKQQQYWKNWREEQFKQYGYLHSEVGS